MPTTMSLNNPTGRLAAEHPGAVKVGRAGWFAKGVVYVIAGVLALIVVASVSGGSDSTAADEEASPTGALKKVAGTSAGPLLLWVLAIGLFLYAAWRLYSAILPGSTDAEGWIHRVGYVVSAIIYGVLAVTAISLAHSRESEPNGNRQVSDLTADVMKNSAGRWVIALAGLIAIGAGLYRMYKGVTEDVSDELDLSGMSAARIRWTRRLGSVGEFGRGVGFGMIGFFLVRAAVRFDAAEATGLDGALRRLADSSWGLLVVAVIGIGFTAYGLFCLATFTHRRLQAP